MSSGAGAGVTFLGTGAGVKKSDSDHLCYKVEMVRTSGVRRKFSWVDFIQWHIVIICIWCAVFVTSPFDVIFLFRSQRFRVIC